MKFGTVFAVVGMMLAIVGVMMAVPALYGLFAGEEEWTSIAVAAALTVVSGIALRLNCRRSVLTVKDSFGIVGFGWLATAAFGALPFIFTLPDKSAIDCLFESLSGVTTTGATILNAADKDPVTGYFNLPTCVLLWRSMLQWIGGLGVIMMVLVLLPFMEGSGLQILRAEVTVISQKIRPKMRDTGMVMAGIYVLLTFLDMVLLHLAGMSLFDSVCHAFSTLSTGGFSPHGESLGGYNNVFVEWITILFMFAGGASFLLHFRFLRGEGFAFFRSAEIRIMVCIVLSFAAISTLNRFASGESFTLEQGIREGVFTGLSFTTGTGFTNAKYFIWPTLCALMIVILMFSGGCVGSTSGSIKIRRLIILVKAIGRELRLVLHPNRVLKIKVDGSVIDEPVVRKVVSFVLLWIMIFLVMAVLLAALGSDMETAVSAAAACLCNVGPAFGQVTHDYSVLGAAEKVILMLGMLIGRLEIFSILILFSPAIWRRPSR